MLPHTGLLFDLDETLVQTASTWRVMHQEVLGPYGYQRTPEMHERITGLNVRDQAIVLHQLLNIPGNWESLCERMRTSLIEQFQHAPLQPMPGACELVQRLAGLAPMAVASGSPEPAIRAALERLHLDQFFTATISSESVAAGKPQPDVFLAAADALQAIPARCVVFEDSVYGAQAARNAGMSCMVCAVSHGQTTVDMARPFATRLVDSWDQVSREEIANLLNGPPQTPSQITSD